MVSRGIRGLFLACAVAAVVPSFQGRAADVAAKPNPIKSYYIKEKIQTTQRDGSVTVSYMETWCRQPDCFSVYATADNYENRMVANPKAQTIWVYDAQNPNGKPRDVATVVPTDIIDKSAIQKGDELGPKSSEELLEQAGPGSKLAGTETILGRVCDVVKDESSPGMVVTSCVDRETGMPLKMSQSLVGKISFEITAVEFKVSEPISEKAFDYHPPTSTFIIKGPVEGLVDYELRSSWSLSEIDESLRASARHKNVKTGNLYRPTYIPKGYSIRGTPGVATYGGEPKGATAINYLNSKTGDTVVFVQSAKNEDPKGSKFVKNGFSGSKISGKEPYPYIQLRWKIGQNSFMLFTSNISEEETIKIAKSVKPVSQK